MLYHAQDSTPVHIEVTRADELQIEVFTHVPDDTAVVLLFNLTLQ